MFFDSHVHYDDKRFDKDRKELLESLNEKDNEMILVKYDFYFKDKNDAWVHKTNKKIVDKNFLTKEALEEIKKGAKSYDIDPPKIGSDK